MIDGGLRTLFHSHIPEFHWVAIETGLTHSGVPDSNYCYGGKDRWVEFKQTETYRIKQTKKTPFQIAWHERRARAEGKTFLAVRRWHDGGVRLGAAVDELYIFSGTLIRQVYTNSMVHPASRHVFFSPGGPSFWDWKKVRSVLLS